MWKRFLRPAIWAVGVVLILFLLRYPILRGAGNFLIKEDPLAQVDAVFVLGGSVYDRGVEAARVHQQGLGDRFIFTGAPIPNALEALGIDSTEAECTRNAAVQAGLPLELTTTLNVGTSTYEEFEALLEYAKAEQLDTVMVISSCFHLRRIGRVFRKPFRKAGITVLLHGAPSSVYDEARWWESEEGLIMVNNEYTKLVYYLIKY
ncbi:MAG TPA: YdcF family protein [Flavobacteriales bacterium]|nr:YdcF family protein [Flavobacteriales bacterium]